MYLDEVFEAGTLHGKNEEITVLSRCHYTTEVSADLMWRVGVANGTSPGTS